MNNIYFLKNSLFNSLQKCVFLITLILFICISSASACFAQITLIWDANTEPEVAGYKVYSGTASRTYTSSVDAGNQTTFIVTKNPSVTTYFAVTAYAANGDESDFSNEVIYSAGTATTSVTTTTSISSSTTTTVNKSSTTTTVYGPGTTTTVVGTTTISAGDGGSGGGGTVSNTKCTTDGDCEDGFVCNTDAGMCVQCVNDTDCTDDLFCNGEEVCVNNTCLAGTSPCQDGEQCDEASATCSAYDNASACTSDFNCNDGIFCNGEETCRGGTCVAGEKMCREDQECSEEKQRCVDIIQISITGLINTPRRPVYAEKRCQWLMFLTDYTGDINFDSPATTIEIAGSDSEFYGVEFDTGKKCIKIGSFILVPVCISSDATSGDWTIIIQTRDEDGAALSLTRMETRFQIK